MKPYQLVAPLLAVPFVAAAHGQHGEHQECKQQPITQKFSGCACPEQGKSEHKSVFDPNYPSRSEAETKERYMYVNTLEFGKSDLVW